MVCSLTRSLTPTIVITVALGSVLGELSALSTEQIRCAVVVVIVENTRHPVVAFKRIAKDQKDIVTFGGIGVMLVQCAAPHNART